MNTQDVIHDVKLPPLYWRLTERSKKRFAWEWCKRYYPEYDPLPVQDKLHENILQITYNVEKARQQTKDYWNGKKENEKRKNK